jgi:asparagine synthase (glutamine-hydrolysing)
MADTLSHRGPDDEGFLISGPAGLAFRRLSIIDLAGGHQPLPNTDETVWTVFNGEIYNYKQLRRKLVDKGYTFRTQSDTEVIVHLYDEYGDSFVNHLTGMFGLAIWDTRRQRLVLARDRAGIKPLYYAETPDGLAFGSEIKALLQDPAVSRDVDLDALNRFLSFYYLPGEDTLFRSVKKLGPGCLLVYENGEITNYRYWDLEFDPQPARPLSVERSELLELLSEVVNDHLIADVPVGLLLSGGVDSTAVLALAAERGADLSTFTIGFSGENFADERPYARVAAERFGTDHHETSMSARDFFDGLPRYVWHMEEPVCEPPAIALYSLSKMAARHVKVVLSGEGGDEAFAGYSNYRNNAWFERVKRAMGPARTAAAPLVAAVPNLGSRLDKYRRRFDLPLEDYYLSRTSSPFTYFNENRDRLFTAEMSAKLSDVPTGAVLDRHWRKVAGQNVLNQMLYVDTKTWLPDDLLIKADKMTMATSLELRVPLLDHRVLEYAARLPSSRKLRGLQTKYLLKSALKTRVPSEIRRRKKAGFPVPYVRWMSQASTGSVRDLLLEETAIGRGYFERSEVERLLQRNADQADASKEVFGLVVLELWHRLFVDGTPPSSLVLD